MIILCVRSFDGIMTAKSEKYEWLWDKTDPLNEFITKIQFTCKCVACGCGTYDYESVCVRVHVFVRPGKGQLTDVNNRTGGVCFKHSFGINTSQLQDIAATDYHTKYSPPPPLNT